MKGKLAAIVAVMATSRVCLAGLSGGVTPQGKGDQVIFYYDARANFTTFMTIRNEGSSALSVRLQFFGSNFSSPATQNLSLAAGATEVIDVGALRDAGTVAAEAGAAFATAVNGGGQAVVTRVLSGNFTVANLLTNSAWGAAGTARNAIQALDDGSPASLGAVIDGTSVAFPPIEPTTLDLAGYYRPESLQPVGQGGNQLIFLSFNDASGGSASAASTTWNVTATRGDGSAVGPTTFTATGVVVSDLASVAGSGVNGARGSITFTVNPGGAANRLIFFTESLGTFGTGYLLPPT